MSAGAEPQASIAVAERGEMVVLTLTGEIDLFNADDVARTLDESVPNDARAAVVDLSALGFMDSTGLRLLFALSARLVERRQELRIVAVPGSGIARTLELVDFRRAALVHPTLDAALGHAGVPAPERT